MLWDHRIVDDGEEVDADSPIVSQTKMLTSSQVHNLSPVVFEGMQLDDLFVKLYDDSSLQGDAAQSSDDELTVCADVPPIDDGIPETPNTQQATTRDTSNAVIAHPSPFGDDIPEASTPKPNRTRGASQAHPSPHSSVDMPRQHKTKSGSKRGSSKCGNSGPKKQGKVGGVWIPKPNRSRGASQAHPSPHNSVDMPGQRKTKSGSKRGPYNCGACHERCRTLVGQVWITHSCLPRARILARRENDLNMGNTRVAGDKNGLEDNETDEMLASNTAPNGEYRFLMDEGSGCSVSV